MSPRSLFNVILKILGILVIKDILIAVPGLFAFFMMSSRDSYLPFLFALCTLGIYISVFSILVFRTDWLINILGLDKNISEETFSVNLHRSAILMISIFIIGGLMAIDAIPQLITQLITYWQEKKADPYFGSIASARYMIMDFVRLLIGLLLIGNAGKIASFIELNRRRQS